MSTDLDALPKPRLRFGEAASLKSFRSNADNPLPASRKANSLKTRRTIKLPLPSLLGLNRKGSRLRDSISEGHGMSDAGCSSLGHGDVQDERKDNRKSSVEKEKISEDGHMPENAKNTFQRPRSKSRTIIRMITSKFRTRSPSPAPPATPAPPIPKGVPTPTLSAAAKSAREAALRERGLLPPLKPNKDLSQQEHEQDKRIPVVSPPSQESSAIDSEPSAADLIKKQWESMNKAPPTDVEQRQRLSTFRFGGLPPPSADVPPIPSSSHLTPVVEVDTPLPSPIIKADKQLASSLPGPDDSSLAPSEGKDGAPPLRTLEHHGREAAHEGAEASSLSSSGHPHLIPLPPSPLPSVHELPVLEAEPKPAVRPLLRLSPLEVPLPISPAPSAPSTPKSTHSKPHGLAAAAPTHLAPISVPVLSLSPPGSPGASPKEVEMFLSPISPQSPISPLRTASEGSVESDSVLLTPSLDHSSQTMTTTTLSTSEAVGAAKTRLKIKPPVNANETSIPMIVESPVEEMAMDDLIPEVREAPESGDASTSPKIHHTATASDAAAPGIDVTSTEGDVSPSELAVAVEDSNENDRSVRRGLTAPPVIEKAQRRFSSFSPFSKRGHTTDATSPTTASSSAANTPSNSGSNQLATVTKKLTIAKSFNSLRNSVVGTLSRPKKGPTSTLTVNTVAANSHKAGPKSHSHSHSNSGDADDFFDASHLPPSPSRIPLPASASPTPTKSLMFGRGSLRSRSPEPSSPTSTMLTVRKPIAVPVYSHGSILMELGGIEDEETRRMTELAFCG